MIFNVNKEEDFSEWYSEILKVADLVDLRYNVKGFLVHKPYLMRIIKRIYDIWEGLLEEYGHEPVLFPLVIPPENFEKEKEHVEGFKPEVFWITEAGGEKLTESLALRPTSEIAFYQMYSLWIRSHTDLPLKLYQSCAVYRHETRATKPLIRGREFLWIEAHDAFAREEEARDQIIEDIEITRKTLYECLSIPFIFFLRPEWDKFKGAEETYAADTLMPDGRLIQLPSTHFFGHRFSKPFEIMFEDKDGEKKYVYTTSYGPPIWRTAAAMFSIHGDEKGLVLPYAVAPIHVIIVPIIYKDKEKLIIEKCRGITAILERNRIRAKIDDSEKSPGEKYYFWEMKGVPLRIEIGPKDVEEGVVVIVRRDTGEKESVKDEKLVERINDLSKDISDVLRSRANKHLNERIRDASSIDEIEGIIGEGIARAYFCSVGEEGRGCAEKLKEHGGEVRGTRFDEEEVAVDKNKRCVVCGKPARHIVYIARAY
jgi:prolyl-tRNA synthetase